MAKKILLVDDDIDFVEITKSQLRKGGFDVEVAYNGEECIEKVKKDKPDLILLDIMMPVMNGYDTCLKLKSNEETKTIPVILLTSLAKDNKLESKADDYIQKPPNYEDLIKSINALI